MHQGTAGGKPSPTIHQFSLCHARSPVGAFSATLTTVIAGLDRLDPAIHSTAAGSKRKPAWIAGSSRRGWLINNPTFDDCCDGPAAVAADQDL
jgi:hypothetical protein